MPNDGQLPVHAEARGTAVAALQPPTQQLVPALVRLLPVAALLLYLFLLVRMAWVSDDAFITLRALDNLLHGYGLVSNPAERVLGFTNPLWASVVFIPLGLGVSAYWAALASGLVVSAAAAVFVTFMVNARRVTSDSSSASLVALWLACSAAYVDFSTSGLENPLAHLLLAIFVGAFLGGRLRATRPAAWLIGALIALNRLDHALLVAPALACLAVSEVATSESRARDSRRIAGAALVGSLPLVCWLGFAVVYYGFPFPNTAYAKLNTSLPSRALIGQGIVYLLDSVERDPLTLLVIALGCFSMLRDRSRSALAVCIGIALYLVYIVRIGGDFMSGRFLTAPFFMCVTWLAVRGLSRLTPREMAGVALASAVLGASFSTSFRSTKHLTCEFAETGIANERECYMRYTGLLHNVRRSKYRTESRFVYGDSMRQDERRVTVALNVGMTGFAAGPKVHVIDRHALTDPLLARIPFRTRGTFRIGHFARDEPKGYARSVLSGQSQLADRCLRKYYSVLLRVIRGPLFSTARFQAIWDLNIGRYDKLVQAPCRHRRAKKS